ncbi:MAG TPA: DedA family protein [Candidatus Acidoferrales bacterium]|nr:DedA family protein [Candidatus Acidoferrales bacterium]
MPEAFRPLVMLIADAIREHQYVTLFAVIAIEEAGVPLPAPGDLIIAFYGWRASGDPVAIAKVVITCALASATGTLAPYFVARRFGETVAQRVAGWLDIDLRRVDQLEGRVVKYGTAGVLVGRLIPGLRVAVSLVAGTARLPLRKFTPGIFVAAAIYWTGWALLGAIVGPHVRDVIRPAYVDVVIIAIPVLFIGLFVGRLLWARRSAARA